MSFPHEPSQVVAHPTERCLWGNCISEDSRQHEPRNEKKTLCVVCQVKLYTYILQVGIGLYDIPRCYTISGNSFSQFSQHLSPPHSQLTIFTDGYFTARVAVHSSEGRALSLIALCIFDTSLQKKTNTTLESLQKNVLRKLDLDLT